MKKISILFLTFILTFSIAGCSKESDARRSEPSDHGGAEADTELDTESADVTGTDEAELPSGTDAEDAPDDKNPAGVFDLE